MENKARKMFAAVVVIMLCAVAIVGVGYAYTATTRSSTNSVTSEYIQLSQGGTGAYTFTNTGAKVYYNTINTNATSTGTQYTLTDTTTTVVDTKTYNVVKVSKPLTILTSASTVTGNLDVSISSLNVHADNGWYFIIKAVSGDVTSYAKTTADDTWTGTLTIKNTSGSSYSDTVIEVFYGYDSAVIPTTAPHNNPLEGATINFTVSKSTAVNGIALDKSVITIASGSTTLTATLNGTTIGSVVWTSGDESKVTVSGTGTHNETCTVTFHASGSTTVTATVTIDDIQYVATCSINPT